MKRKSLVALIASLAVFGVVLTGCGSSTEAPVEEAVQKAEEEIQEVGETVAIEAVQEEEAIQEAGEAVAIEAEEAVVIEEGSARYTRDEVSIMTKAYADFFSKLNDYEVFGVSFTCLDINSDGIPEIIYQSCNKHTYLVYLEKLDDNAYQANEIQLRSQTFLNSDDTSRIITYNPETGVFYANPVSESQDEDGNISMSSSLYMYNDFHLEQVSAYYDYFSEYNSASFGVELSCSLMDFLDTDLIQFFEDCEGNVYGNGDLSYSEDNTVLYLWLETEEGDKYIEAYNRVYEEVKQLQDSWGASNLLYSIHLDSLQNSITDWYDSGEVSIKALKEYTNLDEFWSYFDYE